MKSGARELVLLCLGYFAFCVVTGTQVKVFPKSHNGLSPEQSPNVRFLMDNKIGPTIVMLLIIVAFWLLTWAERRRKEAAA